MCPVEAPLLEADVPGRSEPFVEINRTYYERGLDAAERMLHQHLAGRGVA